MGGVEFWDRKYAKNTPEEKSTVYKRFHVFRILSNSIYMLNNLIFMVQACVDQQDQEHTGYSDLEDARVSWKMMRNTLTDRD